MKSASQSFFYCFLFFVAAGCAKWVNVPPPVTQVTADGAFSNDATAEATVTGLYSQIMTGSIYFLNGANTLYPALSADELYGTLPDERADAFSAHAISAQNSIVATELWGKAYSYLYQVNACLEGVAGSAGVSPSKKEELSGEMLFIRALSYFYLINLFGDVPLELTTDYTRNEALPRSDTGIVYDQIVADLNDAETLLRSANAPYSQTRPSAAACAALKARVFLYRKEWANAAAEADSVINSSSYSLENPESIFLAGSTETIFSFSPVIPGINTAEGLYFIPYDDFSIPLYAVPDSLPPDFEAGDRRKEAWLDSNTVNGHVYHYPHKYKSRGSDGMAENYVVLRLAELYLIQAEARAQLHDINGAVADLNIIRSRAGLPLLTDELSADELLKQVMQENRIEFFCEWGHRWLDLKRTGLAEEVLGKKAGWQPTDVLYPIPYSEVLLNPALTQNEGY